MGGATRLQLVRWVGLFLSKDLQLLPEVLRSHTNVDVCQQRALSHLVRWSGPAHFFLSSLSSATA